MNQMLIVSFVVTWIIVSCILLALFTFGFFDIKSNGITAQSYIILLMPVGFGILLTVLLVIFNRQFRDVFNQKIASLQDDLEESRHTKMTIIGELGARMAHDIRNPLSIIKNSTVILASKYTDESSKKYTTLIDESVQRISHQINDVLEYVRETPLVLKSVDIYELLNKLINSLSIPKNIKTSIQKNHITIIADAEKLETLFSNLILNSIQALEGSRGQISIGIEELKDRVRIEVEDSGPGIPEENLDKIFEPLFTTKLQGTGLGLASVKSIVEQHGGRITVKNIPTTFSIDLPIKHDKFTQITRKD